MDNVTMIRVGAGILALLVLLIIIGAGAEKHWSRFAKYGTDRGRRKPAYTKRAGMLPR